MWPGMPAGWRQRVRPQDVDAKKIMRRKPVNRMLSGLGQEEEMPTDIVTLLQEFYKSYRGVAPTIEFLGSHPWLALTLLAGAMIAGGAVGGYIGAGYRTGK